MREATIIYPHQLYKEHPAVDGNRLVVLVEEPLFFSEYESHAQKLLLHRLSIKAYEARLKEGGYDVLYIAYESSLTTDGVYQALALRGITTVHVTDTTDCYLEKRISRAVQTHGLTRVWYESPLFILQKDDAVARYKASKKHLARFYKQLRTDRGVLIDEKNEPEGGKWSFDEENRKPLPKKLVLPEDPVMIKNDDVAAACAWLKTSELRTYGEAQVWLPYTHATAEAWFRDFLSTRFENFGTYEDAISDTAVRLFHSALSPLINIGLLSPEYVLLEAIAYASAHAVPLNSLEGFVRQLLGWREFIRAAYECDGVAMRTRNFWQHSQLLPKGAWDGTTGVLPVDAAISRALQYGYSHHIERLMVLGNYFLLTETNPDEVYRWFMAMYVDAYDWVMVPNVYGMSQFADGGLFATKPYLSGGNYIKKMSSYPKGEWEAIWTALYWNFIHSHREFFLSNHRLSMMPRLLAAMDPIKRESHLNTAKAFLKRARE